MSSSLAVSKKSSEPSSRSNNNHEAQQQSKVFTIELSENEPVKSKQQVPFRPSLKTAKSDNFQKQNEMSVASPPSMDTPMQTERSEKEVVNMEQVNQKLLDPTSPNNNNSLVLGDLSNVAMKSRNSSMTMASSQFSSTNSSRIHSPNKQMMLAGQKSDKSVKQKYLRFSVMSVSNPLPICYILITACFFIALLFNLSLSEYTELIFFLM